MKTPRCTRCKRPLKDPVSIAIGMGPDCRGELSRRGWKFPKPVYRVVSGHVELVKMVGKVEEPPSVNVDALPNAKAQRRKGVQHVGEE